MELSTQELNQMLADARRAAAEETEARLAAERQQLRTELADARTQTSGDWIAPADAPTVKAAARMHLEGLANQGTRRTYRTCLEGVLVTVPPCHGRGQLSEDGRLAIPEVDLDHPRCAQLGCDAKTGKHAPLGPMSVAEMRDRAQELELLRTWGGRNAKAKAVADLRRDRHQLLRIATPDLDIDDRPEERPRGVGADLAVDAGAGAATGQGPGDDTGRPVGVPQPARPAGQQGAHGPVLA